MKIRKHQMKPKSARKRSKRPNRHKNPTSQPVRQVGGR